VGFTRTESNNLNSDVIEIPEVEFFANLETENFRDVERVHCHAIKNEIENHSLDNVKKL